MKVLYEIVLCVEGSTDIISGCGTSELAPLQPLGPSSTVQSRLATGRAPKRARSLLKVPVTQPAGPASCQQENGLNSVEPGKRWLCELTARHTGRESFAFYVPK